MGTIVILGGGITKKGNLPKTAKKRVEKAKKMFERTSNQDNILASGKYSFLYPKKQRPKKTEAEAIKEYLLDLEVPEKKIFLERKSKDIVGNAYYSKKTYFIPQKEREAKIIISELQVQRVKFVFKKIFGKDYNLKFFPVTTPIENREKRKKIQRREKYLLRKTKKMLKEMKPGNHNFLKGKIYKFKFYKEKRPSWAKRFAAKGR